MMGVSSVSIKEYGWGVQSTGETRELESLRGKKQI